MARANPSSANTALLGFARRRRTPSGRIRLDLLWGRILLALTLAAVASWMAKSVAFYYFFKYQKNFPEVAFADMVAFPFNIDAHRVKMGDWDIDQCVKALAEGDFARAEIYALTGVARSPGNLRGRLILARFLQQRERPDKVLEALRQGLPYVMESAPEHTSESLDYVRTCCRMFLFYQLDEELMDMADELLPVYPDPSLLGKLVAYNAANAAFLRGNFDRADDYLQRYSLTETVEGLDLAAQVTWARGEQERAIAQLDEGLSRFRSKALIFSRIIDFFRQMEDDDRALSYARRFNIHAPLSAVPRIEILHSLHAQGDEASVERQVEQLIDQFDNDEAAMRRLGEFATKVGDVELSRRIYELSLERDYSVGSFALLYLETNITAGDFEQAIEFAEDLERENPEWIRNSSIVFSSLRAVAYFGANNEEMSDYYLNQFTQEKVRAATLLAVARRFREIGAQAQARKVLLHTYQRDPSNQRALRDLIDLDLDLGNSRDLTAHLRSLLQLRRPPQALLRRALVALGSDRFIFTAERDELIVELAAYIENVERQRVKR